MCRWMAWDGQPVLVGELLLETKHGLIDQSLHSRMGAETTNGDGFGLGWYGAGEGPAVYHSVSPAWGDRNLRELAHHVESPMFMAHVRATSGTAIQETVGVSDGESLWAIRHATEGRPRTLFASAEAESLRRLHPDNPRLRRLHDGDRLVVSEPFSDLPGAWHEVPASTALIVEPGGEHSLRPFQPA